MEIASVEELLKYIRECVSDDAVFRGQTLDWPLLPSIGRFGKYVKRHRSWRGFHEHLIKKYIRLGRPYLSKLGLSETDIWIHGQHHGLPTRLLDWSTNPLKALFFSLNNTTHDDKNGVLWVMEYVSWRSEFNEQYRDHWERELVLFLPDQSNPRLVQQEGCFLSYPLPENTDSLTPVDKFDVEDEDAENKFSKIIVPASAKESLRYELKILGIRYRLLFPDIEGVAKGIRLEEL